MKKINLLLLLLLLTTILKAQNPKNNISIVINNNNSANKTTKNDNPSKEIFKAIEKIILEEKMALKNEIKKIEEQLITNEINETKSDILKKEAAKKHASNIESKIALEEIKLQKIVQDYTNKQIATISIDSVNVEYKHGNNWDKKYDRTEKMTIERLNRYKTIIEEHNKLRFDEQGIIAFGLYNVIEGNKLSSNYKTWKSNFFEYGYTIKWRLSKNPSPFYFKNGMSLIWSDLSSKKNLYHLKSGNETNLVMHPKDLKTSRLKNLQLIIPFHFELDLSKPDLIDGVASARKEKSFRLGFGGYGGLRLYSRQIIKYKENGIFVKEKSTNNYNLNNFTYGLSTYVGFRSIALYAKYDLNSLFKNSNTNGVSLGLRLEI